MSFAFDGIGVGYDVFSGFVQYCVGCLGKSMNNSIYNKLIGITCEKDYNINSICLV